MAITFKKPAASAVAAPAATPPKALQKPTLVPASGPKPSWMSTGAAAANDFVQHSAKVESEKEARQKAWRFTLKPGETGQVTFLDGDVLPSGIIVPGCRYNEHQIFKGKGQKTDRYVCIAEETAGNCPLCLSGNQPRFMFAFTIIDHREITLEKGPNAGKVLKDQIRLFIAGKQTIDKLSIFVGKKGQLRGSTYEISRSHEDKAPGCGDIYEFQARNEPAAIVEHYGETAVPLDYAHHLPYHTAAELVALGYGAAPTGPGYDAKGSAADHL
jgi:hypothetical protein